MAHMNDGSTPAEGGDFTDYVLIEDASLYPHQYSQHPQHPQQYHTSAGEILFDRGIVSDSYSNMLGNSSLEDLHSATQDGKTIQLYTYSDSAAAAYQPPSYFSANTISNFDGYHTTAFVPRIFGGSAAEEASHESPIDDDSNYLIPPAFTHGIQLGHNDTGDYRSTPGASPATSVSGFDGIDTGATHSSIHSAAGLGSARSSAQASPFSVHEDIWNPPLVQAWDSNFIGGGTDYISEYITLNLGQNHTNTASSSDPEKLTNGSPHEEPISRVPSPYLPASPHPASNPPSPTQSRKRSPGRLSPLTGGRSHPTFPYPPPRRDSIRSNASSRGSKSPRLESPVEESNRMPSPSSPTGQPAGNGRDSLCPECGKTFRDMRAHLLTHKLERPEKCPIATCEYSKKGFARKYDCQRHTLTHYKGTMVCGFCPCAGSPAEKSFNRADVFKRHLMSVHNVEQQPPNGRKKTTGSTSQSQQSPSSARAPETFGEFEGTGKCSTCSITFSTAQQFYEHLDDCVLSKVVQEEPAAAYNEMNLSQIKLEDIADSLANNWGTRRSKQNESEDKAEEEDEDEDEDLGDADEDDEKDEKDETWTLGKKSKSSKASGSGSGRTTAKAGPVTKIKRGVRYRVSKAPRDGAVRSRARRGGKKRKNFPAGWGCSSDQMVTKRRCLVVYKGPSVLLRDEMMMNTEWEVRASMGGENYVSDLDFWTLQRANAALEAAPSNLDAR
ncbi:hypothetical protein DFH27DRAFT_606474 [Peziza echinospora]|nr:hypothetical protein DFH27DRAFT_606474 [Peziza echinospora]